MSCKKPWTFDIVIKTFPESFIKNELKTHHKNVLFDREQNLLPETQYVIEKDNIIEEKGLKIIKLRQKIKNLYSEIQKAKKEAVEANKEKEYVMPCINTDCRGFLSKLKKKSSSSSSNNEIIINNQNYECSLCEIVVCTLCREEKIPDEKHKCNKNSVKTVRLLKKDCKPCPKCGSQIYKIEGCVQMWCTQCKTAFNWETLELIKSSFHNPHYIEWLKNNRKGNAEDDEEINNLDPNNCENHNHWRNHGLIRDCLKKLSFSDANIDNIFPYISLCNHIIDIEYPFLLNSSSVNESLRKEYLLNQISKKKFIDEIYQKEIDAMLKHEIYLLFDTFVSVCKDLLNTFIVLVKEKDKIKKMNEKSQLVEIEKFNNILNHVDEIIVSTREIYSAYADIPTRNLKDLYKDFQEEDDEEEDLEFIDMNQMDAFMRFAVERIFNNTN
jgi:hypothetical protein